MIKCVQTNTLAAHCHELAVEKDAEALERKTRGYLDEAHQQLLMMASKGKITSIELAADTIAQSDALKVPCSPSRASLV